MGKKKKIIQEDDRKIDNIAEKTGSVEPTRNDKNFMKPVTFGGGTRGV